MHFSARSGVTYLRVRALRGRHLLRLLRRALAAPRGRAVPPGQREPGLHLGQTEAGGAEVATERGCIRGALGGGGGGELAQPGRRLAERASGAEGERDERECAARRTWLVLELELKLTTWRGSRWTRRRRRAPAQSAQTTRPVLSCGVRDDGLLMVR